MNGFEFAPNCGGKQCMRCRQCLAAAQQAAKQTAGQPGLVMPTKDIPPEELARRDVITQAQGLIQLLHAYRERFKKEALADAECGTLADAIWGPQRTEVIAKTIKAGQAALSKQQPKVNGTRPKTSKKKSKRRRR